MRSRYIKHHRDGSVWARGWMQAGKMVGAWAWYRTDGSKMRAGSFRDGVQIGTWTTYDQHGRVVKITNMKREAK